MANRLVAATFARSILSFPLDSILPEPPIVQPNDVADVPSKGALLAFPNPFESELTISMPSGTNTATIHDVSGRVVYDSRASASGNLNERITLSTGSWAPGSYVLTVTGAGAEVQQLKILKRS
jgi:hypothetical protein